MGDQSLPPLVDVYRMSEQFNQEYQAEGAPFGTRGGTVIRTYLPLDGEYRIHIELADAPREPHQLEIAVDDERVRLISAELQTPPAAAEAETAATDAASPDAQTVAEKLDEIATEIKINSVVNRRFELDRRNEARRRALAKGFDVDVPMKAGPRAIAVTFLKRTSAKGEALIRPRLRGRGQLPAIASITIRGPQKIAGAGRYTEPPQDLRLHARQRCRGAGVCKKDPLVAGTPRLSTARQRRRSSTAALDL